MLSLRHGTIRGGRKERPVNVLAIYMANELLQAERDRAFERAIAYGMPDAPSLSDRIASAAAGLRRLIGSPVATTPVLPKLGDNPYRG
jgi:hypothetical protein